MVLLPMLIDYFNGCTCAHNLGIAAQIQIMGESSLVFKSLWFDIYLWLTSEKYKTASWKKKEFEDLKDLLVPFRLYYLIVEDWSCISIMEWRS
jgi:hypothetical protein